MTEVFSDLSSPVQSIHNRFFSYQRSLTILYVSIAGNNKRIYYIFSGTALRGFIFVLPTSRRSNFALPRHYHRARFAQDCLSTRQRRPMVLYKTTKLFVRTNKLFLFLHTLVLFQTRSSI